MRHELCTLHQKLNENQLPPKLKEFKQMFSACRLLVTVFWNCHGALLCEFMPHGKTNNTNSYSSQCLRNSSILSKLPVLCFTKCSVIHDNVHLHAATYVNFFMILDKMFSIIHDIVRTLHLVTFTFSPN